jgi:hypothetical protein
MKSNTPRKLLALVCFSMSLLANLANAQDSWTTVASTTVRHLYGAVYHEGEFLVLGGSGTILNLRANESLFYQDMGHHDIYDAVYSHGRFLAVGNATGVTNGRVYTSHDSVTWTENTSTPFRLLRGVASDGERIVTVGHLSVWVSLNGVDFTRYYLGSDGAALITHHLRDVTHGDGKFVAVGGSGGVLYSADGINWNRATPPSGYERNLFGVSYGNGRFVAVGDETPDQGGALTSSDGIIWEQFRTGSGQLNGITFGHGKFVAVGDGGTILSSDTGAQWVRAGDVPTSEHLNGVAFGGRKFIAVGQNGTLLKSELAEVEYSISKAVELIVPTMVGKTYQILATRNAYTNPVIWEDFGEPFVGDGEVRSLLLSTRGTDLRFFRVVSDQ